MRGTSTCTGFNTLHETHYHAKEKSKKERSYRFIIKTGDVFFSSTTAQLYWYEQLITAYYNGLECTNQEITDYLKNHL